MWLSHVSTYIVDNLEVVKHVPISENQIFWKPGQPQDFIEKGPLDLVEALEDIRRSRTSNLAFSTWNFFADVRRLNW